MTADRTTVTLVTGASSGLGRALALKLAAAGHWVVACARNQGALWQLAEEPQAQGRILPVVLDITQPAHIAAAVAMVQQRFARLDTLVLNAGTCEYVDAAAPDLAMFERVMQLNFHAQVAMVAAFQPLLQQSAQPQVAFVSSLAHLFPFSRNQAYGASKAALSYYADSLRVDLPWLHVLLIEPGFVDTPLTAQNNFDMPFLLTADDAAARMTTAITQRQLRCRFPRRLVASLNLLRLLPYRIRQQVAAKLAGASR